jgi:hypothetical protein
MASVTRATWGDGDVVIFDRSGGRGQGCFDANLSHERKRGVARTSVRLSLGKRSSANTASRLASTYLHQSHRKKYLHNSVSQRW